ncbi:MAG TPA: mycothiol synthase [Pilimelia sp.]|nr:mycothiol synthase [Pilimelia sp.]
MSTFAVQARRAALTPAELEEVEALAAAADTADGAAALSEQTLLALRHGGPGTHLLVAGAAGPLGYGFLAPDGTAEWLVHPLHRHRGVGRALAVAARDVAGASLAVWAHGDHPAAAALALRLDLLRARELWRLCRPGDPPAEAPVFTPGVRLRSFRPGVDEAAWLRLNARAFANHPEQGRWTAEDLRHRQGEPWFDPAGFLLAERTADGTLLGFHWTKVHGTGADARGEVYVLGVDPDAHGEGLGRALTLAGLRHLAGRGVDQVLLYVDATNTAATTLYGRLGFARHTTDVQYRPRAGGAPGPDGPPAGTTRAG